MANYTWLTFGDAKTALAQRLADPSKVFWVDAELAIYIKEALRTFNVLTGTWNAEFQFQAPISANQIWYDLSTIANSPRLRTVTDADVYSVMRYHLIEPQTAPFTSQFDVADFIGAVQRRRDEVIQSSACNLANIQTASTPDLRRTYLPDNTLEVVRARYIPDPAFGSPFRIFRDDNLTAQYFEPDFLQESQDTDKTLVYDVVCVPPLSLDVDVPPNVPGQYDLIVIQAGAKFIDGTPKLLQVPDDFSWVVKWGALADLLGRESEATDRLRADWCLQRYMDGLKLMGTSPWLLWGSLNDIPVDTPSLSEMDDFQPEWDSTPDTTDSIVTAGIDFFAVSPVPTTPQTGVFLTVLGNAPIPVNDNDFVQVSPDAWDSILSYAQFLCTFKQGGSEFVAAKDLESEFIQFCAYTNERLKKLGIYSDILRQEGHRQDVMQERA